MVGFFMVTMPDKNKNTPNSASSSQADDKLFGELIRHVQIGFDETERRTVGRKRVGSISFNEADELFRSWLDEGSWPYDALLFDPRVFTFIFEKTSRLIANKPKGRLIPREGSDILGAKINNMLLDYQWDMANWGGPMLSKWALMDLNARKYGAGFGISKWRYEVAPNGKCLFDGPEFRVLNNRDVAHELSATSIESCNWFLVREFVTLDDLNNVNDSASSKPIYKNLDKLRDAVGKEGDGQSGDTRTSWISRNRQISRLEIDPYGKDNVFKTVEIVTEYRRNRWITFAPKHGVVIRDIENPYQNNELPIVMLRYYQIDDDLYGLSEIEPVKGLQKAINALLCEYVDEINQQLYSPIAIGPGVRQHTLEWGKGARWIMNNPMTDFRLVESRSNAAQYFNNTYSVLVSAMMNALGESSLGVSNVQPYQKDKTATEVKALQQQRNARDQFQQNFLGEAIKRQMRLWYSMNQLLLFSDSDKQHKILRVVGREYVQYLTDRGLDRTSDLSNETMQTFIDARQHLSPENKNAIQVGDLPTTPLYPVTVKKDGKEETVPKFQMDEDGQSGDLFLTPSDVAGQYDFSVDVISMMNNAEEDRKNAQQTAVSILITNPNVPVLLQQEGYKPKFKDLFVDWLQGLGFTDGDKYFEKVPALPGVAQSQILNGQVPQAPNGAPAQGGGNNGQGGMTYPFGYKQPLPNQFMWTSPGDQTQAGAQQ